MAGKGDRCWPGYEQVPGKKAYTEGSCRKKAASKATRKKPAANKRPAK